MFALKKQWKFGFNFIYLEILNHTNIIHANNMRLYTWDKCNECTCKWEHKELFFSVWEQLSVYDEGNNHNFCSNAVLFHLHGTDLIRYQPFAVAEEIFYLFFCVFHFTTRKG